MSDYYNNYLLDKAHKKLIRILDNAFTPDVRIKVTGDNSIITACESVTKNGADYLLHNAILERSYDAINTGDGITFEILDA
jgi:hypothetical protein